jgi:hypothetical protein
VLANYSNCRICLLGGGIVIKPGDEVVGAIGAAGAPGSTTPALAPAWTRSKTSSSSSYAQDAAQDARDPVEFTPVGCKGGRSPTGRIGQRLGAKLG